MVPLQLLAAGVPSCPGGTCLLGTHGLDRNTSLTPLVRSPCSPHTRDPQRVPSHVHLAPLSFLTHSHKAPESRQESHRTLFLRRFHTPRHSLCSPHTDTDSLATRPDSNLSLLTLSQVLLTVATRSASARFLAPPPSRAPPLLFGRVQPLSANRGRTRLLPSSP